MLPKVLDISSELANVIKINRADKHVSQKDYASMLGVSEERIRNYETGLYDFKLSELVQLSNRMDMELVITLKNNTSDNDSDDRKTGQTRKKELLDISVMGNPIFSTRVKNALYRNGITNMYALSKQTKESIESIHGIGELSVGEVCAVCYTYGIDIKSYKKTKWHPIMFAKFLTNTVLEYCVMILGIDSEQLFAKPYANTNLRIFCEENSVYTNEDLTEYLMFN